MLEIRPQWDAPLSTLRHSWEGLVNIDQFRWFVRRDTQEQLAMAVKELGARHVRAVGIFDDELRVLRSKNAVETEGGPNWQLVDYCIDSLLDIGIAPMFTTCFTPLPLASGESQLFTTKANASVPNDWKRWAELVEATLKHFVWRYGANRVRDWYCEVWNEPNLEPFWRGTKQDFFQLWRVTHAAIRAAHPECRIGGPSTARAEWIEEFILWARQHDCEPDYIVGHIYNNDSESSPLSPFDGPQEDRQSKSPHFGDAVIRGTRQLLDGMGFKGELQWNEWGRSWWPRFPERETPNEAAFIVKSMASISNMVDQLAPWCLSDIYDQCGYSNKTFTGNYGLLNLQGLRKPAYNAYRLLSRLGEQRVPSEPQESSHLAGGVVSPADGGGFDALVYIYAHEQPSAVTFEDVAVSLPPGFRPQAVELTCVDNDENDIVAEWRRRGAPDYLSLEETRELRELNAPLEVSQREITVEGGQARFRMQRGSIVLLSAR